MFFENNSNLDVILYVEKIIMVLFLIKSTKKIESGIGGMTSPLQTSTLSLYIIKSF